MPSSKEIKENLGLCYIYKNEEAFFEELFKISGDSNATVLINPKKIVLPSGQEMYTSEFILCVKESNIYEADVYYDEDFGWCSDLIPWRLIRAKAIKKIMSYGLRVKVVR